MTRKRGVSCDPFDGLRADRGWRIWGGDLAGQSRLIKVNQAKFDRKEGCERCKMGNVTRGWRTKGKWEVGMRNAEVWLVLGGRAAANGRVRMARKTASFCDIARPKGTSSHQHLNRCLGGWRIWSGGFVGESRLVKVSQGKGAHQWGCKWGEMGNATVGWNMRRRRRGDQGRRTVRQIAINQEQHQHRQWYRRQLEK